MDEDISPEEYEALRSIGAAAGYDYPQEEEKHNVFTFFKQIIKSKDTTKTANLDPKTELGFVKIPVRTNLNLALYCNAFGMKGLGSHFANMSHIITDSSLSKDGFLPTLAVTQRRSIESKRRTSAVNTGWFKKKQPQENIGGI